MVYDKPMAKGIRILHLDDDPSFLSVSQKIMLDMDKNLEVDLVQNLNEALKKLETKNYDVIVSDYEMPERNGLDFLKMLREKEIITPFILFTGKGREEVAIKALNLGADGYYTKQGDPETVYGELIHGIKLVKEKNKAKNDFEESENRYRTLLENISDAVFIHDGTGKILDTNKKSGTYLGYTNEEILQMNISQFGTLPNDLREQYWNRALSGEIVTFESSLKRKDNSTFPVEIWLRKVSIEKKDLILASLIDISERKNAEYEREQKYEALERVAESLDSGLVIISKDYRVIWANEVLRKRYYISNKKCYQIFNRLGSPCPDCGVKKIFEQNVPLDVHEYEALFSREKPHWVEIRATPLKNKTGEVTSVIELTVPITERKKAEETLRRSQKDLEIINEKLQVIGSLTRHDIGNTLTTAKLNLYLLKKKVTNDPQLAACINSLETAFEQSAKILEFSRIYEKIGAEKLKELDVAKQFDEASTLIPHGEVQLINEAQGLSVLADSMLRQLFYNLIDNSLKHGKTVSEIKLSFKEEGQAIKLIYEDNGVGIASQNKDKIFLHGFTTGGSGIGLKLVKRMIEVYGWAITEEGQEGRNAKFVITIPAVAYNF